MPRLTDARLDAMLRDQRRRDAEANRDRLIAARAFDAALARMFAAGVTPFAERDLNNYHPIVARIHAERAVRAVNPQE